MGFGIALGMVLFAVVVALGLLAAVFISTAHLTWPFVEPAMRFEGVGPSDSQAVALDGAYSVAWTASATSPSACLLEASLVTAADRLPAAHIVELPVEAGPETNGQAAITVPAGQYLVIVRSGCRWSLRLARP